jgi:hypothetical protein
MMMMKEAKKVVELSWSEKAGFARGSNRLISEMENEGVVDGTVIEMLFRENEAPFPFTLARA